MSFSLQLMYQSCNFLHSSLSKSFPEFLCPLICAKHFFTTDFSDGNMTDFNLLRQFYVKSMDGVIYCFWDTVIWVQLTQLLSV